jgi:hypothetical protein
VFQRFGSEAGGPCEKTRTCTSLGGLLRVSLGLPSAEDEMCANRGQPLQGGCPIYSVIETKTAFRSSLITKALPALQEKNDNKKQNLPKITVNIQK